jgi:hypothetical protein
VALSLLVPIGASAIGLGWLATGLVEASLIGWWVGHRTGARVITSLARLLAIAIAAGGTGFAVASLGSEGVPMGILGIAAAELLLLAGLLGLAREPLRATLRLSKSAVSGARAR